MSPRRPCATWSMLKTVKLPWNCGKPQIRDLKWNEMGFFYKNSQDVILFSTNQNLPINYTCIYSTVVICLKKMIRLHKNTAETFYSYFDIEGIHLYRNAISQSVTAALRNFNTLSKGCVVSLESLLGFDGGYLTWGSWNSPQSIKQQFFPPVNSLTGVLQDRFSFLSSVWWM